MRLNAIGRHDQGSLLMAGYKFHGMVIHLLPVLHTKVTRSFWSMRVQVWGSIDWFIRPVHQRHLRRSALAPQLFAAVAGITKQQRTQNVTEGKLLGVFIHLLSRFSNLH